jgi:8-oxo-dGTP diphosphatase
MLGVENQIKKIILRVYALLVKNGNVLVSIESIDNFNMFKFPGGGHELGEGLLETIQRELMEECGIVPLNLRHFYTTDFFQESAFNPNHQIISVYYHAEIDCDPLCFETMENSSHKIVLEWRKIEDLETEDFTFPIDKHVWAMFKTTYLNS